MNDFNDHHKPTPEFRASLEREVARAFRSDVLFEHPRTSRTRRLGMVIGLAMGAVVTLTIGLVLGASTGYASAEVVRKEHGDTSSSPRPALALLRNIPAVLTCGTIVLAAPQVAPAQ